MSNGLGRGLNSLIPQKVNKNQASQEDDLVIDTIGDTDKDKVLKVDPNLIKINPMQPRRYFADNELDELVDSIKQYGIIQPLIVTKKNGEFELIAGERRLRAAKKLNLDTVPVIIREAGEQEKLEVALIENIQRENLNPIETALAYRKLIDEFNLTQEEMSNRVGKSRPSITNVLRLLRLPNEIQEALIDGRITEGHAKYLAGLENNEKQMILFKKILHNKLSVNDTLQEVRRMGGTKKARIKINYSDKDKEFAFREFFGSRVEIKRKGRGGQVIINFYDDDELSGLVSKIKN